ncbi:MAG: hypothetical protein ACRCWW_07220 [Scandinavium sp.]|uniref:hypothetical protein n=1 Tax=Scandinavium sp. TaxID=2830653 RepID=UPI003F3EB629
MATSLKNDLLDLLDYYHEFIQGQHNTKQGADEPCDDTSVRLKFITTLLLAAFSYDDNRYRMLAERMMTVTEDEEMHSITVEISHLLKNKPHSQRNAVPYY